jgi:hypothetical protein
VVALVGAVQRTSISWGHRDERVGFLESASEVLNRVMLQPVEDI